MPYFACVPLSQKVVSSCQKVVSSWWARLLMLNRSCVKSLWSWRATKTCRSSEAVGLLHFSVICISVQVWHHSTQMGWSLLSPPFHRLWYLLLGGWGGRGHLHVKDKRDKNCRSEGKNQGKETRWVVDRIIPVLAKGKRVFASNQSSDLPQISWNVVIWIRITGFVFFMFCCYNQHRIPNLHSFRDAVIHINFVLISQRKIVWKVKWFPFVPVD